MFSPLKLLQVRAKGMEAIKLRIQEVRLKRPDTSFEERICFQDILAAQKKQFQRKYRSQGVWTALGALVLGGGGKLDGRGEAGG